MNGSSSGDSTVFPNNVVFSCDPGFILNGSKTRTCRGNGTWSGIQAVCSGRFLLWKRIQTQKNFMFRCLCSSLVLNAKCHFILYKTFLLSQINLVLSTTSLTALTCSRGVLYIYGKYMYSPAASFISIHIL